MPHTQTFLCLVTASILPSNVGEGKHTARQGRLCRYSGAGRLLPMKGGRPFCWGVISKILIVLGGQVLPGGSFYEKWYKEIFSCYISEEIVYVLLFITRKYAIICVKPRPIARKYEHLRINQIQLRFLHFNQHSITRLGIHMGHWVYKREKYTFINANIKVINTILKVNRDN